MGLSTFYTKVDFNCITPLDWQIKAYNSWSEKEKKGTIEGSTGIGKTKLGIMAVEKHSHIPIFILVPTEALQLQWEKEINILFNNKFSIGLVGGGKKEFDKQITIAIIDSVRDIPIKTGLLILDEVHRYFSEMNSNFIRNVTFDYLMALTATIKRQDEAEEPFLKKFPIVYSLLQASAISKGYLSDYNLINQQVSFTVEEEQKYKKINDLVNILFPIFDKDLGKVFYACKKGDSNASWLLKVINQRKLLICNAENKLKETIGICNEEISSGCNRILIFCEYIDTIDVLYGLLKDKYTTGIYHSKNKKERKQALEDFGSGKLKILITAKALDLGVNIPECDVGILLAGNGTGTQAIQRVGRVIRKVEGKTARVYQLYIPNTKDVDWLKQRMGALKASNIIWR